MVLGHLSSPDRLRRAKGRADMRITWRHLSQARRALMALLMVTMLPGMALAADDDKAAGTGLPRAPLRLAEGGPRERAQRSEPGSGRGLDLHPRRPCRWRSPPSSRRGGASATPTVRKAGVYHSMLSGRRTALVAPWSKDTTITLRDKPDANARAVARLEANVLGTIKYATASGAVSSATASTAMWSRTSSGASIRTRRWTDDPWCLEAAPAPPERQRT